MTLFLGFHGLEFFFKIFFPDRTMMTTECCCCWMGKGEGGVCLLCRGEGAVSKGREGKCIP